MRAWPGLLFLLTCLGLNACGGAAEPARPQVALTLAQRSSAPLPGWEDAVQVSIGDITRGQVVVELLAPEGERLAGPRSLRVGEAVPFERAGRRFVLWLDQLDNALIGADYARFRVQAQRAGDTAVAAADDPAVRIEALLSDLAALDAVRFLRNGQSHTAADAVQHLRQKWAHQRASVRSVEDFIVRCASVSESSGQPYRLQWPDGRVEALAGYLRAQAGLP